MGLSDDLLTILSSNPSSYRALWKRAYGSSRGFSQAGRGVSSRWSEGSARVTLSRLKARGLVENKRKGEEWRITRAGRDYISKVIRLPAHRKQSFLRHPSKRMVILFDIPEREKRKRDWLRAELVMLGFTMMQKSAWFGSAPIHQDFIDALRTLGLLPYLKFFEVKEKDII